MNSTDHYATPPQELCGGFVVDLAYSPGVGAELWAG